MDDHYIKVAEKYGCRPGVARLIIKWCRKFKLPISLGFALFEQESDFKKVFGHDPTICAGWGVVTRAKYLVYKARRKASRNRKMQGVGEGQLTWWETQDYADRLGGCWKAEVNVRVSLETLAARIREYGYVKGIERYNGTGQDAVLYSRKLRALAQLWHIRLTR